MGDWRSGSVASSNLAGAGSIPASPAKFKSPTGGRGNSPLSFGGGHEDTRKRKDRLAGCD